MPSVAIVGAGLIGRSWAIVFARAGWQVRVTDPEPRTLENASRLIREGLEELAVHGLVTDPALAAERVAIVPVACGCGQRRGRRSGERPRARRDEAGNLCRARPALPRACHPGLVDLRDRRVALHGRAAGTRPLPGRASGEPSPSRAARRALRRSLDGAARPSSGRAGSTRASSRFRSR